MYVADGQIASTYKNKFELVFKQKTAYLHVKYLWNLIIISLKKIKNKKNFENTEWDRNNGRRVSPKMTLLDNRT